MSDLHFFSRAARQPIKTYLNHLKLILRIENVRATPTVLLFKENAGTAIAGHLLTSNLNLSTAMKKMLVVNPIEVLSVTFGALLPMRSVQMEDVSKSKPHNKALQPEKFAG